MITPDQKVFFLDNGYLHLPGALRGEELARYQSEFDRVWELEGPPVGQNKLLKHPAFLELIEHPLLLGMHRAFFGSQVQLLQLDLLRQGPHSSFPKRSWHRDFVFPGDRPLSINSILYLDPMTEERGPTYIVPGSHSAEEGPPKGQENMPLPGEVAGLAEAGDVIFINSSIWHSGGSNQTEGLRRGIYLYYGYWWLKRYDTMDAGKYATPWQALENATQERLEILGLKMPSNDLHMYDPRV